MNDARYCQDYGDALDCQKDVDSAYTMDFQDVRPGPEGYIYWCKVCGKRAQMWEKLINKAFDERGPEFKEEFRTAIDDAVKSTISH